MQLILRFCSPNCRREYKREEAPKKYLCYCGKVPGMICGLSLSLGQAGPRSDTFPDADPLSPTSQIQPSIRGSRHIRVEIPAGDHFGRSVATCVFYCAIQVRFEAVYVLSWSHASKTHCISSAFKSLHQDHAHPVHRSYHRRHATVGKFAPCDVAVREPVKCCI